MKGSFFQRNHPLRLDVKAAFSFSNKCRMKIFGLDYRKVAIGVAIGKVSGLCFSKERKR